MLPVGRDDLGFKIKTISKLLTQNMTNSITSLDLTSSQAIVLGYLCYRHASRRGLIPGTLSGTSPLPTPRCRAAAAAGGKRLSSLRSRRRRTGGASRFSSQSGRWRPTSRSSIIWPRGEQRLVSDMSPGEITQLHSSLDRMIQNLSASNGAPHAADQSPRPADETERKPEDRGWQSPDIR